MSNPPKGTGTGGGSVPWRTLVNNAMTLLPNRESMSSLSPNSPGIVTTTTAPSPGPSRRKGEINNAGTSTSNKEHETLSKPKYPVLKNEPPPLLEFLKMNDTYTSQVLRPSTSPVLRQKEKGVQPTGVGVGNFVQKNNIPQRKQTNPKCNNCAIKEKIQDASSSSGSRVVRVEDVNNNLHKNDSSEDCSAIVKVKLKLLKSLTNIEGSENLTDTSNSRMVGRPQTVGCSVNSYVPKLRSCFNIKKSKSVTFAQDTRVIEREAKPRKPVGKLKTNRKPKFAHPCCGHFLPPTDEIISITGPHGNISESAYTRFTSVWCSPAGRISIESTSTKSMRGNRFNEILGMLSYGHDAYNKLLEEQKPNFMLDVIIPLYMSALDIALMDGELDHVEQLLSTVISSVKVLQSAMHHIFFDENDNAKRLRDIPEEWDDSITQLMLAINRIGADQMTYTPKDLAIEPQLVMLQLELMILYACPWNCIVFRSQLFAVPLMAAKILQTLNKIREKQAYYCIKWVNNSVCHRDYMALMKYFGLSDDIGAKIPTPSHKSKLSTTKENNNTASGSVKDATAKGKRKPKTNSSSNNNSSDKDNLMNKLSDTSLLLQENKNA